MVITLFCGIFVRISNLNKLLKKQIDKQINRQTHGQKRSSLKVIF